MRLITFYSRLFRKPQSQCRGSMPPHSQPLAMTSQLLKPRASIVKPKPVVPRLRPQPLAKTTAEMPVLDLSGARTLQRADADATKTAAGIPTKDLSARVCLAAKTLQCLDLNNTMLQALRL